MRRCLSTLALSLAVAAGPASAIVGGTPTTGFGQVWLGVQFTGNWVVTAAHVGLNVGDTFANGYGSSTIAARYDLPGPYPQNDIALLRLTTTIDAPTLSLEATLLGAGELATPLPVTISTGLNQSPRGYGQSLLQEVWNSVDPDDEGPEPEVPVYWLITYGEGFTAPYVEAGDSGGGLFLGHVTDSTSPLLGITSTLLGDKEEPPQYASAFVQLAAYRNWIDATMAADLSDGQMAQWVTSAVPEPATWLLGLMGGAFLLSRSRARR